MYDASASGPQGNASGQSPIASVDGLNRYRPVEPKPEKRLLRDWGLQAWWDYLIGKHYFKKIALCVPHTFIPILKLCADDRQKIDGQYGQIKALHEPVRWGDSPRERWRKFYGSMIREVEWACQEIKPHFNKSAYEELVINVTNDYIQEVLPGAIAFMDRLMCFGKDYGRFLGKAPNRLMGHLVRFMFENVLNITGFLVGPIVVKEYNFREGYVVMEVTDCLWLRSPRMKELPEEGCLLVCKGACEKAFAHFRSTMLMEPGLPDTTCELRYYVDDQKTGIESGKR